MQTTETPTLQDFHIEGVRHVVPKEAYEAIEKGRAVLLDVRELNEVKLESIPLDRVINHPMSVIADRLPYISKDQNIVVICQAGVRSVKVVNFLNRNGYPNVANLEGGITLWKELGLPIETKIAAGGCGCQTGIPKRPGFTMYKPLQP
jgi:rhodanese-related sulfurtransferase